MCRFETIVGILTIENVATSSTGTTIMAGNNTTLTKLDARATLDQDFLFLRAKILEAAAVLDRVDRGCGSVDDDPRMRKVLQALAAIERGGGNRAEQVQLIFSRDYDADWREKFGV
jgi:hypothetical protein